MDDCAGHNECPTTANTVCVLELFIVDMCLEAQM